MSITVLWRNGWVAVWPGRARQPSSVLDPRLHRPAHLAPRSMRSSSQATKTASKSERAAPAKPLVKPKVKGTPAQSKKTTSAQLSQSIPSLPEDTPTKPSDATQASRNKVTSAHIDEPTVDPILSEDHAWKEGLRFISPAQPELARTIDLMLLRGGQSAVTAKLFQDTVASIKSPIDLNAITIAKLKRLFTALRRKKEPKIPAKYALQGVRFTEALFHLSLALNGSSTKLEKNAESFDSSIPEHLTKLIVANARRNRTSEASNSSNESITIEKEQPTTVSLPAKQKDFEEEDAIKDLNEDADDVLAKAVKDYVRSAPRHLVACITRLRSWEQEEIRQFGDDLRDAILSAEKPLTLTPSMVSAFATLGGKDPKEILLAIRSKTIKTLGLDIRSLQENGKTADLPLQQHDKGGPDNVNEAQTELDASSHDFARRRAELQENFGIWTLAGSELIIQDLGPPAMEDRAIERMVKDPVICKEEFNALADLHTRRQLSAFSRRILCSIAMYMELQNEKSLFREALEADLQTALREIILLENWSSRHGSPETTESPYSSDSSVSQLRMKRLSRLMTHRQRLRDPSLSLINRLVYIGFKENDEQLVEMSQRYRKIVSRVGISATSKAFLLAVYDLTANSQSGQLYRLDEISRLRVKAGLLESINQAESELEPEMVPVWQSWVASRVVKLQSLFLPSRSTASLPPDGVDKHTGNASMTTPREAGLLSAGDSHVSTPLRTSEQTDSDTLPAGLAKNRALRPQRKQFVNVLKAHQNEAISSLGKQISQLAAFTGRIPHMRGLRKKYQQIDDLSQTDIEMLCVDLQNMMRYHIKTLSASKRTQWDRMNSRQDGNASVPKTEMASVAERVIGRSASTRAPRRRGLVRSSRHANRVGIKVRAQTVRRKQAKIILKNDLIPGTSDILGHPVSDMDGELGHVGTEAIEGELGQDTPRGYEAVAERERRVRLAKLTRVEAKLRLQALNALGQMGAPNDIAIAPPEVKREASLPNNTVAVSEQEPIIQVLRHPKYVRAKKAVEAAAEAIETGDPQAEKLVKKAADTVTDYVPAKPLNDTQAEVPQPKQSSSAVAQEAPATDSQARPAVVKSKFTGWFSGLTDSIKSALTSLLGATKRTPAIVTETQENLPQLHTPVTAESTVLRSQLDSARKGRVQRLFVSLARNRLDYGDALEEELARSSAEQHPELLAHREFIHRASGSALLPADLSKQVIYQDTAISQVNLVEDLLRVNWHFNHWTTRSGMINADWARKQAYKAYHHATNSSDPTLIIYSDGSYRDSQMGLSRKSGPRGYAGGGIVIKTPVSEGQAISLGTTMRGSVEAELATVLWAVRMTRALLESEDGKELQTTQGYKRIVFTTDATESLRFLSNARQGAPPDPRTVNLLALIQVEAVRLSRLYGGMDVMGLWVPREFDGDIKRADMLAVKGSALAKSMHSSGKEGKKK